MLQKETRTNLKEHSWLYYENKGNKSQSINRLKDQIRTTFSDLTLLASNLPDDIQKEFFNLRNIKTLLYAMENYHIEGNRYHKRLPDLSLAEFLVEYGLSIIINEYEHYEKYSPAISKLTIEHLQRTKALCHDISRNVEYSQREYEFNKSKQIYLFSWKDIQNQSPRVQDYILSMIDSTKVYSTALEYVYLKWYYNDQNTVEGKIIDLPANDALLGTFRIQLIYKTKTSLTKRFLQISIEIVNDIKLTKTFEVKEVGDDLLIYEKKTQA